MWFDVVLFWSFVTFLLLHICYSRYVPPKVTPESGKPFFARLHSSCFVRPFGYSTPSGRGPIAIRRLREKPIANAGRGYLRSALICVVPTCWIFLQCSSLVPATLRVREIR